MERPESNELLASGECSADKSTNASKSADINDFLPVVAPRGRMAEKLTAAAPYNFFLTTITDSSPTHTEPLSITFQELLDPSLGELECSVQTTFQIDIDWLMMQYSLAGYENCPLLILHGEKSPEDDMISPKKPNVTVLNVEIKTPIGVHHTKMGLYGYRDGSMRVVISTANLYEEDWYNRTQGLWISPRLPAVPEGCESTYGESITEFRTSLLAYLDAYKFPQLQPWMERISKTDFSALKVFLVASVPCSIDNIPNGPLWGYPRMGYLLSQHATPIDDCFPLVAQTSAVGIYGSSPKSWIQNEIMANFGRDSARKTVRLLPGFRFIFPSYASVCASYDGLIGGSCLRYEAEVHNRQLWLEKYLYQWISHARHRNKAIPHIKTYCRWSAQGLQWFLLTSPNFSKSAWGINRFGKSLHINNYEAGVLYLPKILLNEDFLPMDAHSKHPQFPMPYDVPIVPYGPEDTPFLLDALHSEESESLKQSSQPTPLMADKIECNNDKS